MESCVVDIEGSGSGGEFVVAVVAREVNPGWALANSDPQPEGSAKKLGGSRSRIDGLVSLRIAYLRLVPPPQNGRCLSACASCL